jgi:hypothetical protein
MEKVYMLNDKVYPDNKSIFAESDSDSEDEDDYDVSLY